MNKNKYTCCICGKEFEGYGNNPWPLENDPEKRCCDTCNWDHVVPTRLRLHLAKKEKRESK